MLNCLDLSYPETARNLACDEVLLEECETSGGAEVLRFWESQDTAVVMGIAARWAAEVRLEHCQALGVPVLRRCSGGGTVVQGPGCLNYALVLRIGERAELATVRSTTAYVLRKHAEAMTGLLGQSVTVEGVSDLVLGGRKISGNAQRRRRNCLLFHGTFLLGLDLTLIDSLLPEPPRAPEYRGGRRHRDFVVNTGLAPDAVKQELTRCWGGKGPSETPAVELVEELCQAKYGRDEWNLRH